MQTTAKIALFAAVASATNTDSSESDSVIENALDDGAFSTDESGARRLLAAPELNLSELEARIREMQRTRAANMTPEEQFNLMRDFFKAKHGVTLKKPDPTKSLGRRKYNRRRGRGRGRGRGCNKNRNKDRDNFVNKVRDNSAKRPINIETKTLADGSTLKTITINKGRYNFIKEITTDVNGRRTVKNRTEPIGLPKPPNTTCTKLGSLDQCAQCRSDDQCQSGKCDSYSKLCMATKWWGRKKCYGAKAYCIKDRCRNADYPEKWGQPTCQEKSEEKVPDTKDPHEDILPEEVDPTDENGPEEDSTDENGLEEDSTDENTPEEDPIDENTPEEDPIDENTPEEDPIDENTPEEDPIDENVPEEDLTDEDGSLDGDEGEGDELSDEDEGDEFTDGELSTDLSDETEKDDSQPPAEKDVKEEKENDDDTTTKHLMMGKEERAAFDEHNRIRTNPKDIIPLVEDQIRRFDETGKFMTIGENLRLKTNEGISAWDEAVEVLKDQETFKKLQWNDYLALAAQDHCNEQGHLGTTGHDSADGRQFTDRINKYGFWSGQAGENLAYSNTGGDEQIVQLYIDDGVTNRGHRVNMLSPDFEQVGMAHCEHKGFGGMLAIAYATGFEPNDLGRSEAIARRKM